MTQKIKQIITIRAGGGFAAPEVGVACPEAVRPDMAPERHNDP